MEKEMPEFKADATDLWSSVFLAIIMVVISLYSAWATSALGPAAVFHLTHGISASWLGVCGVGISVLAMLLEWRGYGLNALAAFLASTSVVAAFMNSFSWGVTITVVAAILWLVVAIHFTRRFYEHNPFLTFLALWGLTAASSFSQSMLYNLLFDHSYPLKGVLLLKLLLFGVGGLTMLFAFPRKNREYEL